jgi:hypothetical protein
MVFLRFVAVLALGFWVGGLTALGATASTLFEVIETRLPAGGRELSGVVFGTMFERFQRWSWVAGLLVLVSLGIRAALGPRPRRFGLRVWVGAGMLAASVSSVLFITPRIERLRAGTNGPVASLPDDDPRRVAFGRWHALSTGLMALTIVAGIGLIWTETTDAH